MFWDNIQFVSIWKVHFSTMASHPHRTSQVQFSACPYVSLLGFLPVFASERCWNCYVQQLCHKLQHEPGIMWRKGNMTIADPCNRGGRGGKGRVERKGDRQLLSATQSVYLDSGCNDFCNFVINTACHWSSLLKSICVPHRLLVWLP